MMDAITEHHYLNIANGKAKPLEDGNLATVNTIIVNIDGVETLIPTVWDGEIVDDKTATTFAINSGVDWPTRTGDSAVEELEAFDAEIHKQFTDMTSPEEAAALLDAAYNQDTESAESGLMIEEDPLPFALGGLAASRQGITTQEGVDMANNKFQLDRKKADKDGDGKLSKYEEAAGEAVQRAIDKDELVEMYHGGMAFDGIMSDPVSGNEIPIGSSAENVRDDIEAMISEGEYVLPANVVKWHGLKHIMDMQAEAEMGLMQMQTTGLIQYTGEEAEEEPEEVSDAEEDDVLETDIEIEVAAVEVDDKLDEDEEVEEIFPRMSKLPGVMRDKKYAFIS
jgi:hypothetical protein